MADLSKWSWLAGPLIDLGAPVLGTALGLPQLADPAARILKTALGLPGGVSADTVKTTIETMPADQLKAAVSTAETEASARWAYLTRLAEIQGEVAKRDSDNTKEVMLAEVQAQAARPDGWWSWWRVWNANELTLEFPVWCCVIFYGLLFDSAVVQRFNDMQTIVTAYWTLRGGLLGIHLWQGSNERQAAITGQPVPGALSTATAAVKNLKR